VQHTAAVGDQAERLAAVGHPVMPGLKARHAVAIGLDRGLVTAMLGEIDDARFVQTHVAHRHALAVKGRLHVQRVLVEHDAAAGVRPGQRGRQHRQERQGDEQFGV